MNSAKPPKPEKQDPKILRHKGPRAARKPASLGGAVLDTARGRMKKPGLLHFTLTVLYKSLYLLGITLLRRRLRLKRKAKLLLSQAGAALQSATGRIGGAVKGLFVKLLNRIKAPYQRIGRTYREVKPAIISKRKKGTFPGTEYLAVLETVGRLILKILTTIFNYTAPVVAAMVLITVIRQGVTEPSVWLVSYDGEAVGYIENKSDYTAATQDVRSRLTTDGMSAFEIVEPQFELLTMSQFEQLKADEIIPEDAGELEQEVLADMLMRMSGSVVEEAYGLYIDNRFLGAVLDKDSVLGEFDDIKRQSYTGKPDESLQFVKSVRLKPGLYPKSSIVDDSAVLSVITSNETSDEVYVVKDNDTPTGIADKTGVPYETLKLLNPDIEESLFVGMEIKTQVARPFMSVQSTFTDVAVEEVPFDTVETQNATYARGYREVDQDGVEGSRRVTYEVRSVDGLEKDRVEVTSVLLRAPIPERVTVGINDPQVIWTPPSSTSPGQSGSTVAPIAPPQVTAPSNAGGFIWPVGGGGGTISCYLNGYWGHTGIDITNRAMRTNTPILASASGTVVLAKNGWTGYGRHIMIDHGNGFTTLYAHNSVLYVNVGDKVAQGQVIAMMGQTGNAYGVHLHFEVRQNGRIMNPVNYVGSR